MRAYRDGEVSSLRTRLFSPMSDITASLALSQLSQFPEMLGRRLALANTYLNALRTVNLAKVNSQALAHSMFFRFPVIVERGIESCQGSFLKRGIQVRRGVDSLLHRRLGLDDSQFETTVRLFNTTVSLPIYPALTIDQELRCSDAIKQIFND